jgi:hypothetical protein
MAVSFTGFRLLATNGSARGGADGALRDWQLAATNALVFHGDDRPRHQVLFDGRQEPLQDRVQQRGSALWGSCPSLPRQAPDPSRAWLRVDVRVQA